jgi:molybdenum cofactor guanylyltransferase
VEVFLGYAPRLPKVLVWAADVYDRGMAEGLETGLSAFVLAGGKSSRMGTDKAFLEFEGRTLLARILDLARSVAADVRIVGDPNKFSAFSPTVEDIFVDCGPLSGIHAALQNSNSELNLMLAVDMPFLSFALLQHLITKARNSPTAAVTVPRAANGWQPLCAVYRRSFAASAENALCAGHYKVDALFSEVAVQAIEEKELEEAGFARRIFSNVNTPEDVRSALSLRSEKSYVKSGPRYA